MKRYPNTSILNIITQKEDKVEKILFINVKPVADFYPLNKIIWYPQKGNKGESIYVWEKLSIKQWVACGKDEDILELFENIITTNKITIASKEVDLKIPHFKKKLHEDLPSKSRDESVYDSLVIEDAGFIPQEFYQKENLNMLSGYIIGNDEIKNLFPFGFFEENFLYNNLLKNTFGIKEYRTPYLTFRGVRKTAVKNLGSTEMIGFYQQNFEETITYNSKIENIENEIIGEGIIDKKNGRFKMSLSTPTDKGSIEILENGNIEKVVKYTLLSDITIDMNIASKTFKDTYGRTSLITDNKSDITNIISNFTWQREVYANTTEADKKLSDKFKEIFNYLGPNILIADPYYINDFKQDPVTNNFELRHCQIAFINSLIHSAILGNIKKITILGVNSRANNHATSDTTIEATKTEQRFNKYESLLKEIITNNNLKTFFPVESIVFKNSNKDFHNRYWFSIIEKDGIKLLEKCIIITNSIGNMNEVDIMVVNDEAQLNQIIRKYSELFKNSEIKLSI